MYLYLRFAFYWNCSDIAVSFFLFYEGYYNQLSLQIEQIGQKVDFVQLLKIKHSEQFWLI
jgi:hypothetical protein